VGFLPQDNTSEDSLSLTDSFMIIAALIIVPYAAFSLYGYGKYMATRHR